jgi:acyl-CoA synthetase (AMP-forming)/AMP-acid ligase II
MPDFSTVNMVDCLRHFAQTQPDHPALEDGDEVISYFELNRRTDELAAAVRMLGVAVVDVVTVALPDSITHLVVNCGLLRDGWYYPGDIAIINGERYLFLAGRADDVINNAGIKYYPIEVETVLLSHPEVAEVAVFSWPHATAGQVTTAAIVARKKIPADDLRKFCRERLADYKTPYAVIFLESLPKNGMGKVLKRQLRASLPAQAEKEAKPSSHN